MKLQYLAVIFVIIILPISMVMSSYIQNQIDTITLQTLYKTKLDNSTYDALKAFQINSVNNKYSSISNSKIRDIEASINTFYNSMKTSMVSSKEDVQTFIPAILFTLYDGYYIYSSYDNIVQVEKAEDETIEKITTESNRNYQYGLRPYIYYSCKYNLNGKTIIVNYTLDNEITVYGDFGNGYETKSGYLIDPSKVTEINDSNKTLKYDGILIEPETLKEHLITVNDDGTPPTEGEYAYIVYNNKKVYKETTKNGNNNSMQYFWYDNYKKTYLIGEKENLEKYIQQNGVTFKSISAYEYYKSAKEFSEWVNENLGSIKQKDVIKTDSSGNATIGNDTNYLAENTGNSSIFATSGNSKNDPMLSDSTFNNHRIAVIRKSIETNLTTAIANYNTQSGSNYEYVMPVINDADWYKIANNVSIASFMQGIPIGQKYFNNYSVITNTKNEEVINSQSMYILERTDGGDLEYHQVGCEKLLEKVRNAKENGSIKRGQFTMTAYTDLSFLRQTVKVSETQLQYFYPHGVDNSNIYGSANFKYLTGCYNCIVNSNADYNIDGIIKGEIKDYLTGKTLYNKNNFELEAVRKTYLTGLARERYDLYKSNFDLR